MSLDPLIRRLSLIAGIFALVGTILGVVAISTNFWSWHSMTNGMDMRTTTLNNGTTVNEDRFDSRWNGLYSFCTSRNQLVVCVTRFWSGTFCLCLFGLLFLFVGGLCSIFEMIRTSDRRFLIPMLFFVGCVLVSAGLFDYASYSLINCHSSRAMVASLVFGLFSLPISAFVAGRYSAYDRYINNGQLHQGQKYLPTATNGN